jgi:hypothetical protein
LSPGLGWLRRLTAPMMTLTDRPSSPLPSNMWRSTYASTGGMDPLAPRARLRRATITHAEGDLHFAADVDAYAATSASAHRSRAHALRPTVWARMPESIRIVSGCGSFQAEGSSWVCARRPDCVGRRRRHGI